MINAQDNNYTAIKFAHDMPHVTNKPA